MSLLYEVYLHPTKGAWGVAIKDQTVHSVMVNESSFVDAELPAHKFAGEISKRLVKLRKHAHIKSRLGNALAEMLFAIVGPDEGRLAAIGKARETSH